MRDIETQAKLGKVFDVEPLQQVVSSLLDNLFRDPAAVLGLTAIKGHDDYTLNHSINVCILSLSLGASLGLDDDSLKSLGLSALLYDLGKVRIPEDILGKQGPLTTDEWHVVKSHTAEGADLLKRIQLVDQMPMIVAFEHHQRHDMQGYPDVHREQEQHLFSKIVALCDAYDAMTTRRPFRREIRPDKALAVLMQGRGKAYDPSLTKSLVVMLGIYPMGAIVTLEDGSTAVVFRVNNDDLLHPRVKAARRFAGDAGSRSLRCSTFVWSIPRQASSPARSRPVSRPQTRASTTSGSTSRESQSHLRRGRPPVTQGLSRKTFRSPSRKGITISVSREVGGEDRLRELTRGDPASTVEKLPLTLPLPMSTLHRVACFGPTISIGVWRACRVERLLPNSRSPTRAAIACRKAARKGRLFERFVVARDGLEPPTRGFSIRCSTT
jgi:hypothetical protein